MYPLDYWRREDKWLIIQVGNDMKAMKFLEELDNHPQIGGLVDCTSELFCSLHASNLISNLFSEADRRFR